MKKIFLLALLAIEINTMTIAQGFQHLGYPDSVIVPIFELKNSPLLLILDSLQEIKNECAFVELGIGYYTVIILSGDEREIEEGKMRIIVNQVNCFSIEMYRNHEICGASFYNNEWIVIRKLGKSPWNDEKVSQFFNKTDSSICLNSNNIRADPLYKDKSFDFMIFDGNVADGCFWIYEEVNGVFVKKHEKLCIPTTQYKMPEK